METKLERLAQAVLLGAASFGAGAGCSAENAPTPDRSAKEIVIDAARDTGGIIDDLRLTVGGLGDARSATENQLMAGRTELVQARLESAEELYAKLGKQLETWRSAMGDLQNVNPR